MKDKILFSVLVTCYNHEKFIEDALASIYHQTYDRIEVLICDDASKDRSWELICSWEQKLQERFERVWTIRNEENKGLTKSLNMLIEESRGHVLFSLSGDDMMAPDYAQNIVEASEKYPDVMVFSTDGYFVDEETAYRDLEPQKYIAYYQGEPDFDADTLFERLYKGNFIFAPGMSMKREIYQKHGLYDEKIMIEDLEYWLRLAVKDVKFKYIDIKGVYYRRNADSMSAKVENESYIQRRLEFLFALGDIYDKYGSYLPKEDYVKWRWDFYWEELGFMRKHMPRKSKKFLAEQMKPFLFQSVKLLGWKQLARYYHMYLIAGK